jgi:hypothetical protein
MHHYAIGKVKEMCLQMSLCLGICVNIQKPLEERASNSLVDTTEYWNSEKEVSISYLYISIWFDSFKTVY